MARKGKLHNAEKAIEQKDPGKEKAVEIAVNDDKKKIEDAVVEDNKEDESYDKIKFISQQSNVNMSDKVDVWREHKEEDEFYKTDKDHYRDQQFFDRGQYDHLATDRRKIGALLTFDTAEKSGSDKGNVTIDCIHQMLAAFGQDPRTLFALAAGPELHSPPLYATVKDSINSKDVYTSQAEHLHTAGGQNSLILGMSQQEHSKKKSGRSVKKAAESGDVPRNYSDEEAELCPVKNLVLYASKEELDGDKKNYLYPSKASGVNQMIQIHSQGVNALDLAGMMINHGGSHLIPDAKSEEAAEGLDLPYHVAKPVDIRGSSIHSDDSVSLSGSRGPSSRQNEDYERNIPDRFSLKLKEKEGDLEDIDGNSIDKNIPRLQTGKRKNSEDGVPGEDWGNHRRDRSPIGRWSCHLLPAQKLDAALVGVRVDMGSAASLPADGEQVDTESEHDFFSSLTVSCGAEPAAEGDPKESIEAEIGSQISSQEGDEKEYDDFYSSSDENDPPEDSMQGHFEQFNANRLMAGDSTPSQDRPGTGREQGHSAQTFSHSGGEEGTVVVPARSHSIKGKHKDTAQTQPSDGERAGDSGDNTNRLPQLSSEHDRDGQELQQSHKDLQKRLEDGETQATANHGPFSADENSTGSGDQSDNEAGQGEETYPQCVARCTADDTSVENDTHAGGESEHWGPAQDNSTWSEGDTHRKSIAETFVAATHDDHLPSVVEEADTSSCGNDRSSIVQEGHGDMGTMTPGRDDPAGHVAAHQVSFPSAGEAVQEGLVCPADATHDECSSPTGKAHYTQTTLYRCSGQREASHDEGTTEIKTAVDESAASTLHTPIQVSSPGNSVYIFPPSEFVSECQSCRAPVVATRDNTAQTSPPVAVYPDSQSTVFAGDRPVVAQDHGYCLHPSTSATDHCEHLSSPGWLYTASVQPAECSLHSRTRNRERTPPTLPGLSPYSSAQHVPAVQTTNHCQSPSSESSAPLRLEPIMVHDVHSLPPTAATTPAIDLSLATNREFVNLLKRRATYSEGWPTNSGIDAANMALAGFFCLGRWPVSVQGTSLA